MKITINSQNNELMSLLEKNPNSDFGVYLKEFKNGVCVGLCESPNEYTMMFQDSKYSFMGEDRSQMDYHSMCSPEAVVVLFNQLMGHLLKSKEEVLNKTIPWLENNTFSSVDNQPCTIIVNDFLIESSWYRDGEFLMSRYFNGVTLTPVDGTLNIFTLTLESDSVFNAVNTMMIISFLTAVSNSSDYFMEADLLRKYVRIFGNVPTPYFVYYLFIKRCIVKKIKLADELLPIMEEDIKNGLGLDVKFTKYDTHGDRIQYVGKNLDQELPILNFGCDGFIYEKRWANKGKSPIFSYDIEDFYEMHLKIKERMNYPRPWEFIMDLTELDSDLTYQVVMSEVMEHIGLDEFIDEVNRLVSIASVSKMIITTPNKEFNKFYGMSDDDVRRHDHVVEINNQEFKEYIGKLVAQLPFEVSVEFENIGDLVNGECVTSGCVLTFK